MKIPRWLPPVVFGGLTLILFREFIVSGGMLYGGDTLALGYMARDFLGQALTESGTFPLWNPIILGGTPFIESLAGGDSLYPTSLLLILMETHRALGWKLIIHVFLAGIFMFGWVRVLGRSRSAALLAGVAYTLAPFMVTQVYPGADGKLFVTALAPLLFWVAEWSLVRRGLLPFVVVALVIGLVILTTHFQMAYFLFGAVGLYYVFRIVRLWRAEGKGGRGSWMSGPLGKLSLFLLAALLGAALAAVQLLPAVDYVTEHSRRTATTTRASDDEALAYSSSFALHPEEVAGLVVPEFVGGTLRRIGGDDDPAWTDRTYWGRNPLKYNSEYAGIVVLLLAGIAFLGAPRRGLRWFFAGLGALSILFGLGTHTPVWRIFYEIIPGISLFRAPSQAAFLFGFSAVTLMAFGFDRAVEAVQRALGGRDGEGWHRISLYLWSAVGAFGLLLLMAASGTLSSLWTTIFFRDIDPARAQLLTSVAPVITRGALIAFGLVAGTVSLWWAFRRGLFRPPLLLAGVGLLIAIDLLRVDAPFIQTFEFQRWAEPNANIRFLLERQKEEPPFRVLSLTDGAQDVKPGMYGLELAGGHHPNDLGRYRELIGMTGSGSPRHLVENSKLRALLNIGYLIWPDAQMRSSPQGAEPLSQVSQGGQVVESVYRTAALPRAYLVGEAIVVPDDEAVDFMLGDGFDPSVQVVLSEEPPIELPGGTVTGDVRWEERGLNHQRLVVRASQPALLVISDNWFSSWRARIDGEAQPLLRADHALRAVPIPEGEHSVELYYDGSELRKGLILSGFTLFLLLVTGGLQFAWDRRLSRARPRTGA